MIKARQLIMTPQEHADDIMKRCWWKPECGEHPGFKGLEVEIVEAIQAAVERERALCASLCAKYIYVEPNFSDAPSGCYKRGQHEAAVFIHAAITTRKDKS